MSLGLCCLRGAQRQKAGLERTDKSGVELQGGRPAHLGHAEKGVPVCAGTLLWSPLQAGEDLVALPWKNPGHTGPNPSSWGNRAR